MEVMTMLHKIILVLAFGAMSTLYADTTASLAKQQELLSQKLIAGYTGHRDISGTIDTLEEKQNKLNSGVKDPEIKNLLKFMNICIKNIKHISNKPYSHSNRQRIADLSISIGEGSRYILNNIR
jgi:hypothetical protein